MLKTLNKFSGYVQSFIYVYCQKDVISLIFLVLKIKTVDVLVEESIHWNLYSNFEPLGVKGTSYLWGSR